MFLLQSYMIAETDMSGESGFDFVSSGQAFNTLAEYIFGKVRFLFPKVQLPYIEV